MSHFPTSTTRLVMIFRPQSEMTFESARVKHVATRERWIAGRLLTKKYSRFSADDLQCLEDRASSTVCGDGGVVVVGVLLV